jgi:hypothetical protein
MRPRRSLALVLGVCLAPVLLAAPAPLPDTTQGRRIDAFLKAFSAGTPEAIRAFISENFAESALAEMPLEQRVQRLSGIAKQTGPLELSKVTEPGGSKPTFLAARRAPASGSRSPSSSRRRRLRRSAASDSSRARARTRRRPRRAKAPTPRPPPPRARA